MRTIIEPFKIKSVEPIRLTTRSEREDKVYTQSHIDYVVEAILDIWKRRSEVKGYRFVEQAPILRHFTARLKNWRGSG